MDKQPEYLIGPLLRMRGWTLVTAESCTGGLIGHLLTSVPGSSDYYLGGGVTYSNQLKMQLLGVQPVTLETHGAVSAETAAEMAAGARQNWSADVALSVTGIAGPGGAIPGKPVGLTFIGLSTAHRTWVRRFTWNQDRAGNMQLSAERALTMLLEYLETGTLEDE
jgi:PncC family amidohydrolase